MRGIEEDQLAHAVGGTIGDSRDHHPAVAVTDEYDLGEVLEAQELHDVTDVQVEVDARMNEVRSLAESRECGGVHLVAGGAQERRHLPPAPAPVAAAVD